jgi:hypothetical protein
MRAGTSRPPSPARTRSRRPEPRARLRLGFRAGVMDSMHSLNSLMSVSSITCIVIRDCGLHDSGREGLPERGGVPVSGRCKHRTYSRSLMRSLTRSLMRMSSAQKLSRSCPEAAQKLPRSCPEAVQKLPRSCRETHMMSVTTSVVSSPGDGTQLPPPSPPPACLLTLRMYRTINSAMRTATATTPIGMRAPWWVWGV